jgi:CHASE2 domain-containing sensor protein
MKKLHLIKEAFIATLIVLIITYLISFIPLSLEYGKALHQGFADFDIYDLYYSGKARQNIIRDTSIVLVELGADRLEIADQINSLSLYHPKIIAIDATFENSKDSLGDMKFSEAIKNKPNLVFAYGFDKTGVSPNFFYKETDSSAAGYIDFSSRPEYSVIRTYIPFYKKDGKEYEAFTTSIARLVNPGCYQKLKKRNNNEELINYTGNLNNYFTITKNELYNPDSLQLEKLIRGKLVLLGFFMKDYPLVMEDLYYSPLNERVSGKSFPDIYGVVVHANILSMILDGKYATLASTTTAYIFAFLITMLLYYYFISQFHKKSHPSHGKFLLIQFLAILFVLYLFLQFYNWFLFKVPLEPVLIAMVLSLEMLGLYKNLALRLHKKYHYKTVFTHKHII